MTKRRLAAAAIAACLAGAWLWAAPPLDRTAPWLGAAAVAAAALLFAGHRLRTNRLHAQKAQLEAVVLERTQDLAQAVVWATAAVREAETLRAATEALSGSLDLEHLLQVILAELGKVVACDGASVQELDGHTLRVIAAVGFHDLEDVIGLTFDVRTSLDVEERPDGTVALESKAPRIIADTDAVPTFRHAAGPSRIRSAMWVPLVHGDRLLGMIALDKREPGFYTAEHGRLALAFAAQAAISIENARLFEQARRHAQELTRHAQELEQAAFALRQSEERSRAILETAHDAFVAMDRNGVITAWNAQAEATFGWRRAQAVGRPVADTIVPPEQREAHLRGLAGFLASGEGPALGKRLEVTALHADGHRLPVELTISAVPGSAPSFAAFIRDITERRRAEEAVAHARQAAEEASRAKSAFIASMSHELRTPLNAVLGFVQLMERRPGRDAEDREHLSVISRSGEHLLGLINEVLSIAKIESGQMSLNKSDFDLAMLLTALEQMFRGRAAAKGLGFSVEVREPLPQSVQGDDGKLRQILINLVGNAIKFTATGRVTVRAAWSEGRARFEVEDTGPGLTTEESTRIFSAFSQTEVGRKQQEGTGLGLALSRSYAHLMGGEIHLESVPDRGCVFRVEIALPQSGEGAKLPRREARRVKRLEAACGSPSILVVDDHAEGRVLLAKLLTAVGFDVRSAADGREGLAAWRASRPDLVFMDVNMPGMDGLAATRALRADEAAEDLPRTPVVAFSASVFEHERRDIKEAGCDLFLAKPFQEEDLFELLAQMLGVSYEYEETEATPPAAPLTRERLGSLPEDWRGRFRRAIELADTDEALRLVAEIQAGNDALARDIADRLRAYRMDELEELLGA